MSNLTSFCNISLYNYSIDEALTIKNKFIYFDRFCGLVLILFLLFYSIYAIKDLIFNEIKQEGFTIAQIMYMIGLLSKGVAFILSSISRNGTTANWGITSALLHGLSGYLTGTAYCFIFFCWTSVCLTYLGRDFARFLQQMRKALYLLVFSMVLFFIVTISFMNWGSDPTSAHYVEAIFASFRDLVLSLAFYFYFRHILSLAEPPYCDFSKPETGIIVLCGILIFTLFLRAISILSYAFYWSDWGNLNRKRECKDFYFYVYLFEQTFYEILPLLLIGITRIKHLWNQSYDPIPSVGSE